MQEEDFESGICVLAALCIVACQWQEFEPLPEILQRDDTGKILYRVYAVEGADGDFNSWNAT